MKRRGGRTRLVITGLVASLAGGCESILGITDLPGLDGGGTDGSAPKDATASDGMGMPESSTGTDAGNDSAPSKDSGQGDTAMTGDASTACILGVSNFGACTFGP